MHQVMSAGCSSVALTAAGCLPADFLYAIEGLGQGSLGTNWGDGLATNRAVLKASGASDPNPFFQSLLRAPYRYSTSKLQIANLDPSNQSTRPSARTLGCGGQASCTKSLRHPLLSVALAAASSLVHYQRRLSVGSCSALWNSSGRHLRTGRPREPAQIAAHAAQSGTHAVIPCCTGRR